MNAINRLRYELRSYYGIPYEDDNTECGDFKIERIKLPTIADCCLSIIQGTGTHGAEKDLLEIWDTRLTEPYPQGKTVQEAITMIIEHVGL